MAPLDTTSAPSGRAAKAQLRGQAELAKSDPSWRDPGSVEMGAESCFPRNGDATFHTYTTYTTYAGPHLLPGAWSGAAAITALAVHGAG